MTKVRSRRLPRTAFCLVLLAGLPSLAGEAPITDDFRLDKRRFTASGSNTWLSLNPGTKSAFGGEEDGAQIEVLTTVLDRKRWVSFDDQVGGRIWVRTRVVEERRTRDGELVEISRKFLARCRQTSDIFYFGRKVWQFKDEVFSGSEGTWEAGVNDARPGLLIPGTYLIGSRYNRERAPGCALSRVEHTAMGLSVKAGDFAGCVELSETDSLGEVGNRQVKVYCPGAGLVLEGLLQLVDYRHGSTEETDGD